MFDMESYYQCKSSRIAGSSYKEVWKKSWKEFQSFSKRTKRTPYIRSKYFGKRKVFLNRFYSHLYQKNITERRYRLRYLASALELIEKTVVKPTSKKGLTNSKYMLHRFTGKTKDGLLFYVQVKENITSKELHFMSCFGKK